MFLLALGSCNLGAVACFLLFGGDVTCILNIYCVINHELAFHPFWLLLSLVYLDFLIYWQS